MASGLASPPALPPPIATRGLRIALLTSSRFWRGSSTVFAELGRGLAARGHVTTALVAYERLASGFRARGVSVRRLPVAHTSFASAFGRMRPGLWGAHSGSGTAWGTVRSS